MKLRMAPLSGPPGGKVGARDEGKTLTTLPSSVGMNPTTKSPDPSQVPRLRVAVHRDGLLITVTLIAMPILARPLACLKRLTSNSTSAPRTRWRGGGACTASGEKEKRLSSP